MKMKLESAESGKRWKREDTGQVSQLFTSDAAAYSAKRWNKIVWDAAEKLTVKTYKAGLGVTAAVISWE